MIIIALLLFLGCTQAPPTPSDTASTETTQAVITEVTTSTVPTTTGSDTTPEATTTTAAETIPTEAGPNEVTFVVTGQNFKFQMDGETRPELKVKEGDKVRIEFTSIGGFHDWIIDEFNAATTRVNTGGSTVVEFIADKKGTFQYYCSVGSHRQQGMFGNLVVE